MSQWIDPYAGFQYEEDVITVGRDYQQDKLQGIGIDAHLFGNSVDPAFFIGLAIHAGIRSGIAAEGNVNMLQSVVQHRAAKLDEQLTARGQIADVRAVPRGRTLHSEVTFYDSADQPVITANRVSLKPDPAKLGVRGAGERPELLVTNSNDLTALSQYQLTPDNVKGYSSEGNSIHYEEGAAKQAGFRAPLIGGGMGVHFLMAQLWRSHLPSSVRMEIYFRRPIFWDETVTVAVDHPEEPVVMALLKPAGKVGTELKLSNLVAGSA